MNVEEQNPQKKDPFVDLSVERKANKLKADVTVSVVVRIIKKKG